MTNRHCPRYHLPCYTGHKEHARCRRQAQRLARSEGERLLGRYIAERVAEAVCANR